MRYPSAAKSKAPPIIHRPEGSYVKAGDLSWNSILLRRRMRSISSNQRRESQFGAHPGEQQLEIQKSVVDSEIQAAELKVEFAASDLEKFAKGEALRLSAMANEITNVLETLQIAPGTA